MKAATDYLLIVEDDPDILRLLEAALTFKGYRVITAHNGKEGLELIETKHPAIVIADIMMPKLDGFGLVHRMRIHPETRDIPVVFITATYVSHDDRSFALHLGATRFLQKPLDLEKFLATVKDLLEQGLPTLIQPLSDFEFYQEYRRRLEQNRTKKSSKSPAISICWRKGAKRVRLSRHLSVRQSRNEMNSGFYLTKSMNN